jgi:8-oxo-dGTP pyrophosphatase MutT (NUDIX family)
VRNQLGEYLAVKETKNRGWWLPAGAVDEGEDFPEAAIRETIEEAGIKIQLMGVLRVEHSVHQEYARMRVIFYAIPDPKLPLPPGKPVPDPKSTPDKESDEARWVTLKEYPKLGKLRGNELLIWGKYLEDGGVIYPLSVLTGEADGLDLKSQPFYLEKKEIKSKKKEAEKTNLELEMLNAVESSDLTTLKDLISQGADINRRFEKRWTILHHALKIGDENVIEFILTHGADPFASSWKGRTPLHFAASNSRPRIIELVLKYASGSLLVTDDYGETPFHMAFINLDPLITYETLAKHNPHITAFAETLQNRYGKTPLDLKTAIQATSEIK